MEFKDGEYCEVWVQGRWFPALYSRKGLSDGEHLAWVLNFYPLNGGEAMLYRVPCNDEIRKGEEVTT